MVGFALVKKAGARPILRLMCQAALPPRFDAMWGETPASQAELTEGCEKCGVSFGLYSSALISFDLPGAGPGQIEGNTPRRAPEVNE